MRGRDRDPRDQDQEVTYRGGQPWVETVDYSYHVFRRHGQVPTHLVRYDNSAHHRHPDPYHRHRYDANGQEILPPEHVGEAGWPTLGEVIEEAYALWRPGG